MPVWVQIPPSAPFLMSVTIVLDVMGADRPPHELVTGALKAAARLPVHLVIAGRRRSVEPYLPPDAPAEILDCEQVVEASDAPVGAIRKRASSLVRGMELLRAGKADAFLSPGNTGAVVGAALLMLGRLPGVQRPGLCASLPTLPGREILVVDAGANADPKPQHLLQYAVMGRLYAQDLLGTEEPKLGLLNIGTEPGKGNRLIRAASRLLEHVPGFSGNVEPHDLLLHRPVDVVVCGGFSGNLAIKALEGGAELVLEMLRASIGGTRKSRLGGLLLRSSFRELALRLRYDRYNGAPLLGVRRPVAVAHGRSSPEAMEGAVARTFWAVRSGLLERLARAVAEGTPTGTGS